MKRDFSKEEHEFLLDVSADYVALHQLVGSIMGGFSKLVPSEKEFLQTLEFIAYLFEKYGKHLSYSTGPGDPIDKTPEELIAWLKQEWKEGHYKMIHYGVWFDLDRAVIPPEFLPSPE